MPEAYCLRCRAQRQIAGATEVKLKNGRPAVRGTCPVCKTKLFRITKG